ncbi:PREDICTED: putative F-box protein At3g23420 [Camelina sativa]|uniref:F-box protein At3g23420 n=1 Tax=Camelina sativa TaxID=90675 RepID=A0ABM0WB44_CAMSA|nr:PREDICTED: putative F-box protein At3g23420 [Camelina sativa]
MLNFPKDMAEEVLSRVPVTSMRKVRFACKSWNSLSKCRKFGKMHLGVAKAKNAKKSIVVLMMDYKVYLTSINLHDDKAQSSSCIEHEGKLNSLDNSYEVHVSQVFHCDGLLLCITKDHTKLVVWNPYLGQTQWIDPTHTFPRLDFYLYALGYDNRSRSYKILRFIDVFCPTTFVETNIYDFNSASWRVLDVSPDGKVDYYDRGVSLKGNTYWFAKEKPSETREGVDEEAFLVCFDFTREVFGPLLPLPFEWFVEDTATLSSVREEQLAVLFQRWDTSMLEIWITTNIEPNDVSWSTKCFLALNMTPFTFSGFQFPVTAASFFIDEEEKVAVVFDKIVLDENGLYINPNRNLAYILGVDGSVKKAFLGDSQYKHCYPLVCSYVPSLVQLNN